MELRVVERNGTVPATISHQDDCWPLDAQCPELDAARRRERLPHPPADSARLPPPPPSAWYDELRLVGSCQALPASFATTLHLRREVRLRATADVADLAPHFSFTWRPDAPHVAFGRAALLCLQARPPATLAPPSLASQLEPAQPAQRAQPARMPRDEAATIISAALLATSLFRPAAAPPARAASPAPPPVAAPAPPPPRAREPLAQAALSAVEELAGVARDYRAALALASPRRPPPPPTASEERIAAVTRAHDAHARRLRAVSRMALLPGARAAAPQPPPACSPGGGLLSLSPASARREARARVLGLRLLRAPQPAAQASPAKAAPPERGEDDAWAFRSPAALLCTPGMMNAYRGGGGGDGASPKAPHTPTQAARVFGAQLDLNRG